MVPPSLPLFPLRDPVILISILESGSGIPHSLVYTKRGRTVSSPLSLCDIPTVIFFVKVEGDGGRGRFYL
jgi:hypothetical protein